MLPTRSNQIAVRTVAYHLQGEIYETHKEVAYVRDMSTHAAYKWSTVEHRDTLSWRTPDSTTIVRSEASRLFTRMDKSVCSVDKSRLVSTSLSYMENIY